MVIRIVKMTFRKGEESRFREVFDHYKSRIRATDGCLYLELLHDVHARHVYMTYSRWESEAHLHKYRDSAVFNELWPQAKALFEKPAEAWTITSEETIP